MKYRHLLLLTLSLGVALPIASEAQTASPFQQIMKARRLYACSSFLRASAESTSDDRQKEILRKTYGRYLAQATIEALAAYPNDSGGPELANAISKTGQQDFERFMTSLDSLQTNDERNEKIGQFANSCTKLMQ